MTAPTVDALLRQLFKVVERVPRSRGPDDGAFQLYHLSETQDLLFRNEALTLLDRCERMLSRDALSSDGLSPEYVRSFVARVCMHQTQTDDDLALAWFHEVMNLPNSVWLIATPSRDYVKGGERHVGGVAVGAAFPKSHQRWLGAEASILRDEMKPPVSWVRVTARDQEAAVILGLDRIDEARALLALCESRRTPQVRPGVAIIDEAAPPTSVDYSVST